jgi:hypothetical protein
MGQAVQAAAPLEVAEDRLPEVVAAPVVLVALAVAVGVAPLKLMATQELGGERAVKHCAPTKLW